MSYEQRQSVSGVRSLLLEEQSGRRNTLYVRVITNYEQNTDSNSSGEYRPTTGKTESGGELPRSLIYFQVDKDDPRYDRATESGGTLRINGELQQSTDIRHSYIDENGKKYLLGGIMDQEGRVIPTGVAGAAMRNNFANYNAGKPGSDFTKNTLRLGQIASSEQANTNAVDAKQKKEDDDSVPGTAGLSQGTREEIEQRRRGEDPAATPDTAGEVNPDIQLINTDPVRINTKKGVIGFETKKQFKYPIALIDEKTDYLLIGVREYVPIGGNLIRSRGEFDSNQGNISRSKGTIILPIPSNIQDGNSVKYGDSSLDAITAAVASSAIGVMKAGGSNSAAEAVKKIKESVKSGVDKLGGMGSSLGQVVTKGLAAEAANLIGITPVTKEQLLARESGGILNPNTELLFSGVSLRSFRFSFQMTPRNRIEADEIKSIIRVLKSNMAAKTTEGGAFLSTPNVFDLSYMTGDQPHPFLHSFKTCALTDMSVNYTGDGLYATYSDGGAPISMVMDLTFKELEAIYDEDYENINQGVGY